MALARDGGGGTPPDITVICKANDVVAVIAFNIGRYAPQV